METKKNQALDLERKRMLHFTIGLVLTVAMITVAFEWRSPVTPVVDLGNVDVEETAPPIPPTAFEPPEPPKPKKIPVIIKSVDDDVKVDDVQFTLPKFEDPVSDYIPIEPDDEETIDIHITVEEQPSFPGGTAKFYQYVASHLKYPKQAIRNQVEGKVYIKFVIDRDGSISDAEVYKGIGEACDEEALRVIKNSPKWNPGKQRGQAVRVQMILPITFQLQ